MATRKLVLGFGFVLIAATIAVKGDASVSPSVTADENGFTLTVPADKTVQIKYVSENGDSRTTRVLTEDDLAIITEMFESKIDSLNKSKTDVVSSNSVQDNLQAQIRGAIKLIGDLETKLNATVEVNKDVSACHAAGLLWTDGGCQRLVSCGDTIAKTQISGGRISTSCGSKHFYNDNCTAQCPDGYTGANVSFQCKLDGMWTPTEIALDCVNINECDANTDNCDQKCIDTPGSFLCACNTGFTLDADGRTCKAIALDTQEFAFSEKTASAFIPYGPIPKGVSKLSIQLYGSGGQTGVRNNVHGSPGGRGAFVNITIAVTAGQRLFMLVGGPGAGRGIETTGSTWSSVNEGYTHRYGGGIVGVFSSAAMAKQTTIAVAGSGGAGGNRNSGVGGNGGTIGGTPSGTLDITKQCNGRGATGSSGGQGRGIPNAGKLGGDGGLFHAGIPGNFGNGGGAGYFGGGGGGHCPNVCGCAGGGGSSFTDPNALFSSIQPALGSVSDVGGKILVTPLL